MDIIFDGLGTLWEAVRLYKEAIFGLLTIAGGGAAAFFGSYRRQARSSDERLSEAASRTMHVTVTRLHHADRELLGDVREGLHDMTRAARHLSSALEEQADTCRRAPRREVQA